MILILVTTVGTGFSIEQMKEESENQQVNARNVSNEWVILGGMPIGIYLETDGVLVLGTDSIEDQSGQEQSPAKHLVKEGDYITGINGNKVGTKKELLNELSKIEKSDVILNIRREKECIEVKVKPVMTKNLEYKLGIWIRDSVQGLGTVTYFTLDNKFGALGHGIHDSDTEELLEINKGLVYRTHILNIKKGIKGVPGGLEGMIVYTRNNILGTIKENTDIGIYGTISDVEKIANKKNTIQVGEKSEVKTGKAQILCYVTGAVEAYDIEIEKIERFSRDANKSMVIEVVDEELLEITGGIVQGMSGSPIIQDGKLVGAVTHVLVNDPTRGYGIFIENMLDAAG